MNFEAVGIATQKQEQVVLERDLQVQELQCRVEARTVIESNNRLGTARAEGWVNHIHCG